MNTLPNYDQWLTSEPDPPLTDEEKDERDDILLAQAEARAEFREERGW